MDFEDATDRLFEAISHSELAKVLGVSVAAIRQSRLKPGSLARRAAPKGWKRGVLQLAEKRLAHYRKLVDDLKRDGPELDTKPAPRKRKLKGRTIVEMREEFSRTTGGGDGKADKNSRRG